MPKNRTPDDEQDQLSQQVEHFRRLLKKEEDLLPELQKCVLDRSRFLMVHHPLLISIISSNAYVNDVYQRRLQAAKEAKEGRNWVEYVFVHERPYRLKIFGKIAKELTDAEYWEVLGHLYIQSENLRQYGTTLQKLLTSNRPEREQMMDGRERAYFHKLPVRFIIYRGYAHRNSAGWSWTLDRAKAVWFAKRFAEADADLAGKPKLATGEVKKKDVIAYFSRRKEKEIVVDPKIIKVVSQEKL